LQKQLTKNYKMTEIKVKLVKKTNDSYKIFIQKDSVNKIPTFLKKNKLGEKYIIVTDSKVRKLYGNSLLRFLKKNGLKADIISFPQGEKNKTLESVEKLANEMVEKGFDRKDAIISLGGGVVGDVASLLSAIYMRGIPYIQIPTTLLSMVDSSIGGKTGIDLKSGKNLLGTFTQPKAVFIDIKYLKTLSTKQIRAGLAEIIKYGVIKNKSLFKFIEHNLEKILSLEEKALNKIIKESVEIKAKIVEKDEKEHGERMILNYGHTYGHAIERLSNFKLLHGYAISIGMVIINKFAVEKGYLKKKDSDRIKKLLKDTGLPIVTVKKPSKKDIMSDKKKSGNYINFIVPTEIGKVKIHKEKC